MEVDSRGYVRRLNATFLRWLGIEASRLASNGGVKLADLISAQDLEMLLNASLQVHANNAGLDVAMRADQGTGLSLKLFARRDAAGSLLVAAYPRESVDVTDGTAGAADLRFARFFQSAPFGIATLDASGRLVNSNAAFGRLIPEGAAAHGMTVTTLLARTADAETQRAIETAVGEVLQGTITPAPIEISFGQHKDISRRLFLAPLPERSSSREVATLYVIDATEQKALEAKFAQSSKMEAVGKLAGGIAHDFNNVLTAIIGFSDLLLQTHRPTDPAYKDIKNIQSSANRAAGLVAKLLAFSRRQTQHTEPLQLGDVLTDLGPLMKRSIGETIELKVSAGRDLWYVKAIAPSSIRSS